MNDAELFAFEVPTSAGRFRIIGPRELPEAEGRRIGRLLATLLPILTAPDPAAAEGPFVHPRLGVAQLREQWTEGPDGYVRAALENRGTL